MATGKGSYLEQVTFGTGEDEEILWAINDSSLKTKWAKPDSSLILPSDGTRREDARHILNESWTMAEEEKHHAVEL